MRYKMCKSGFDSELWKWKYADKKPIIIGSNVWIDENVTILKGITIGKGAIIATRAVVTKDVPLYCIVASNPAKVTKHLDEQINT